VGTRAREPELKLALTTAFFRTMPPAMFSQAMSALTWMSMPLPIFDASPVLTEPIS